MEYSANGSQSALSIVASFAKDNPVATTIILGSFAAVIAAKFVFTKYEAYEEKKHRDKVEAVNRLYRKYLENIEVPELSEKLKLPPIFSTDPETGDITSMHFTLEQIEMMHTQPVRITDPSLLGYQELIAGTIRKLREYYIRRKNDTDVTAGVLSWLLYTLDTHCQNFQGYAIDIAFLKSIEKFVSEYASQGDTEISECFSWLMPADACLLKSITLLEKHRKSLSLRDMITELGGVCLTKSNELLRILLKLIVKDQYQRYADFVTPEEMEQGILHEGRINIAALDVVFSREKERRVKSFFEEWIRSLASYYLKTLGLPNSPDIPDTEPPDTLFRHPKDPDLIRYAFSRVTNFLTRKSEKNRLVRITDPYDLSDRINVYKHLAESVHELISLHYLCTQLMKCFQQLGNIYIENPRHMRRIFIVMNALCQKVCSDMKMLNEETEYFFEKMSVEKRKKSFRVLPNKIHECTVFLQKKIDSLNSDIQNAHSANIVHSESSDSIIRKNSIKSHMLEIAVMLEKIYALPEPADIPEPEDSRSDDRPPEHKYSPDHPVDHDGCPVTESANRNTVCQQKITILLCRMRSRILELQDQNLPRRNANAWLNLYAALINLQEKSTALLLRDPDSPSHNERNESVLLMTLAFTLQAQELLAMNSGERPLYVRDAAGAVRASVKNSENAEKIDAHQIFFSRVLFSMFKCRFFQTDTRRTVSKVCDAFDAVARVESGR